MEHSVSYAHHSFSWKTDDPYLIVSEAVELHRAMINEMRGVPGNQLYESFKWYRKKKRKEASKKERKKERKRARRKEVRKEGRKEGSKEGRKQGWKEGTKEVWKEGRTYRSRERRTDKEKEFNKVERKS